MILQWFIIRSSGVYPVELGVLDSSVEMSIGANDTSLHINENFDWAIPTCFILPDFPFFSDGFASVVGKYSVKFCLHKN